MSFRGCPRRRLSSFQADNVRASSTGFVVPRARLEAIGPQPAARSRRRSYLASTPGKTTPLATGAGWLLLVVRVASHPVCHRYIISRAPCPLNKKVIFTGVSGALAASLVHYLFIQRSEGEPLHLGIGHNVDVPLCAWSTSRAWSSRSFTSSILRHLRLHTWLYFWYDRELDSRGISCGVHS